MINLLFLAFLAATPYKQYDVSIVDCYDGDTCTVNIHLGMSVLLTEQKVRLCDINAPEIRPLATRSEATISKIYLLSLLQQADHIWIRVPQKTKCKLGSCDKRGKYGRLLVKIYADGLYVNNEMLRQGLAKEYLECK